MNSTLDYGRITIASAEPYVVLKRATAGEINEGIIQNNDTYDDTDQIVNPGILIPYEGIRIKIRIGESLGTIPISRTDTIIYILTHLEEKYRYNENTRRLKTENGYTMLS